ncbi:chromatin assembly factor 1 subunit FSM [Typha angustifolia]|uniref:chromatin assembly factor 1 subunit FSM n=1 Tax=Typha angustifolia TaxID=59011 RepID=UPI003C2CC699
MILGTINPEVPEVDRDPIVVDNASGDGLKQLRPNAADLVVLNHAPDFDGDPMILDSYPAELSKELQGREGVEVKGDSIVNERSHLEAVERSQVVKNKEKGVKKQLKRKRASIDEASFNNDKEALITDCHKELEDLFECYKEVSGLLLHLEEGVNLSNNSTIAFLLEESNLPFSKLVDKIFERMKARDGITLAMVRSSVLFVGQRTMYGTSNADADVLEDESESCLWCWETRDLKLLSAGLRGTLAIRRTARKKIYERISALSATLSALTTPEAHDSKKCDLTKASMKLGKVLNVEGIRSLLEKLKQRNNVEMAEKEARLKEKELIKEMERNKRNVEKEKKKMDREIQKEKLQIEKELKRVQEEAEKEVKIREKEEAEMKKQLKRQQEEAEREQKRREKEEAELRKQLAIQKQANLMERFLKTKKSSKSSGDSDNGLPTKGPNVESFCQREEVVGAATSSMDCIFSQEDKGSLEDHWRSHVMGWRKLSCCNKFGRWGVRRNPKTELVKELKLQKPSEAHPLGKFASPNGKLCSHMESQGSEPSADELLDELKVSLVNDMPCHVGPDTSPASVRLVKKKLLQFDKSHRPAYYGTWSKKSDVIGGRHPLKEDPMLDYDVDSDEEWEEEDPGESLSDCDKDNEENLEEENSRADDQEESEDSFVVPDSYLSENEGVHIGSPSDVNEDEASSLPGKPDVDVEESRCFLRQQKILHDLTVQALRKNQPLVISNLNHEKSELMMAQDLVGMVKLEQLCLQALCMRAYPGGSIIDMTTKENPSREDQGICQSNSKNTNTPTTSSSAIPDSDLPEFVRVIQSCSHGLSKVVDLLQQKFSMISKSQLRNKVREISDFVDNRWQVKKEVLDKLGVSVSPEKGGGPKGIAMYFSKRCLPPEGKSINTCGSSPQSSLKLRDGHTPEAELHITSSPPQS